MTVKVISNATFQLRNDSGICKEFKSLDKLIKEVKQQAQTAYENADCGFDYDVYLFSKTERDLTDFEKLAGLKEAFRINESHILRLSFSNEELEIRMIER